MDDSETAGIPEHQGETEDLDVRLARAILDRERELLAEGISADESARLADEYGESSLRRVASLGLPELRSDLSDRVSGLEEMTTEYLTTLSRHWASALDQYRLAAECCRLVGIRLWKHAVEEDLGRERLDLQSALAGTWARSVRTGVEVDVLLRAGLPRGAAARARTMHELAVTAFVMSEYGVLDEHVGLGSRYVAYGAVKVWRDAEEYQKHALRLGTEPLTDDEMTRYRREYDEAVSAYPRLDRPNGWAAQLPGYRRGSFEELEQLAGLDHFRPYYSWFSHEVHSNVKGDRLNMVTSPDGRAYHLGPRMDGLADPAHAALRALHQVVAAWGSIMDLKAMDVVYLQAGRLLVDEAADALVAAERGLA